MWFADVQMFTSSLPSGFSQLIQTLCEAQVCHQQRGILDCSTFIHCAVWKNSTFKSFAFSCCGHLSCGRWAFRLKTARVWGKKCKGLHWCGRVASGTSEIITHNPESNIRLSNEIRHQNTAEPFMRKDFTTATPRIILFTSGSKDGSSIPSFSY